MTSSLEGWPTKAKEAPSPHEVRLAPLDINPVFQNLRVILLKSCSVGTNKISDLYEIWQQHKQLKTIEMSEAWPDTYDEAYILQFQPEITPKIH